MPRLRLAIACSVLLFAPVLEPAVSRAAHRGEIRPLLEKQVQVLEKLAAVNDQLVATTLELEELRDRRRQLGYQIEEARRRIVALERRAGERRDKVARRVRSLYKLSRGGFARLLLDQRDARAMVQRLAALKLILRRDLRERRLYKRELEQLSLERRQLEQRRSRDADLERQLDHKRQTLGEVRVAQRLALLRADRESGRLEAVLASPPRRERRLLNTIRTLRDRVYEGSGFVARRGRLPRPVAGHLVASFGQKTTRYPATGVPGGRPVEILRQGLTFQPAPRAPVHAVAGGTVRLAGTLPGFGGSVLIEHEGGFFSLYGFLAQTAVSAGQAVEPGTTLGRAGHDPLDGAPGLYFELRHRERPLDPIAWLKGNGRSRRP